LTKTGTVADRQEDPSPACNSAVRGKPRGSRRTDQGGVQEASLRRLQPLLPPGASLTHSDMAQMGSRLCVASSTGRLQSRRPGVWLLAHLNLVAVADFYPLPNMLDFSKHITGCSIFCKEDQTKDNLQVLMHPADIEKTAIATLFGLYKFVRMTLGLQYAGN
jgi:hypothetical protein